MEPGLKNNSIVLISGIPYLFNNPRIKDIVVLKDRKGQTFIKRIIGIEKGKYFVQGDNLKDSLDSRKFGIIDKNQIMGKLIIKL